MPIQHRQGTFLRMDGDNYIFDVDGTEMSFTRDQIINITRPIGSQNSSFLSQPSVSTLPPPPPKRARVGGVVIPPPGEGNNIQPDEMFAPGALNESSGSSGNSSSGGIDVSDIAVGDQAYLPFNIGAGGGASGGAGGGASGASGGAGGGASGGASGGNGRRNRRSRKTQGGGKRKPKRKSRKSRKYRK